MTWYEAFKATGQGILIGLLIAGLICLTMAALYWTIVGPPAWLGFILFILIIWIVSAIFTKVLL